MGPLNNILIISSIWLLTAGVGTWYTFFKQPEEIEDLKKTEQMARIRQSEVSALLSEAAELQGKAALIQAQWDSRYKTIPKTLKTHEVVGYLNTLTRTGFESFNVTYAQQAPGDGFNMHVFRVSGRSTFRALYDFIWSIENYRSFYRIADLELTHIDLPSIDRNTGRERLDVYVSFDFDVQAYFGGKAGLSAEDQLPGSTVTYITPMTELPPVPSSVLPDRRPAKNPFYPIIMSTIPPNSRGLLDLDTATLISIVDGKAVFGSAVKDPATGATINELTTLGVGDDVYLGRIIRVDPINNQVVARLNVGGIMDEREFELETASNFRQALGPAQVGPAN